MRTDRLSLLVDQLDRAREIAEVRLTSAFHEVAGGRGLIVKVPS
jgi:hypothetical protein